MHAAACHAGDLINFSCYISDANEFVNHTATFLVIMPRP